MFAAVQNDTRAVSMLLSEAGMQNNNGDTALFLAAQKDCTDACKILADYEIGICNNQKQTALMMAMRNQNIHVTQFLIREAQMVDASGKRAIDYCDSKAFIEQYLKLKR